MELTFVVHMYFKMTSKNQDRNYTIQEVENQIVTNQETNNPPAMLKMCTTDNLMPS